ncbi:MAG: RDD family protein [bacterium]
MTTNGVNPIPLPPTYQNETIPALASYRILAYIIDSLISSAIAIFIMLFSYFIYYSLGFKTNATTGYPIGLFALFIGALLIGKAYMFIRDTGGLSIGKRLLGLSVVSISDNSPATIGQSFIRNVVFLIPYFVLIELLMLLTDKDRRRLGDQFAKTRVVSTRTV